MPTLADLARGWMQKGDSDRLTAERTLLGAGPYDTAWFHCQQAVEKYLKAVLAWPGSRPRAHTIWRTSTASASPGHRAWCSIGWSYLR